MIHASVQRRTAIFTLILATAFLLFVSGMEAGSDGLPASLRAEAASAPQGSFVAAHTCSRACAHAAGLATAKRGGDQILGSGADARGYDVLSYDLRLNWTDIFTAETLDVATRQYHAAVDIRMAIGAVVPDTLVLDAHPMLNIETIVLDGAQTPLEFVRPEGRELLCIPLQDVGVTAGEDIELHIAFQLVFEDNEVGGFVLYDKGFTTLERIAYTLSAPNFAPHWFPCNDNPADKALVSFSVLVPAEIQVACTGRRISVEPVNGVDNVFEHRWTMDRPTATYLMAVQASRYIVREATAARPADPETDIPLSYYLWDADWEGEVYNASSTLGRLPDMIGLFSNQFGDYPFDTYGVAIAEPFTYGAMENQTMVTLGRRVLQGDVGTVAHELLHMWMGDNVTPASWSDIWFNEGAATYGEALWAEFAEDMDAYRAVMSEKRGFYMRQNTDGRGQPAIWRAIDPDDRNDIYNYAVTYSKGAWIYHMLRGVMGDAAFFDAMRSLGENFGGGNISTAEFIALVKTRAAAHNLNYDFDQFFDQWIYKRGHPVYAAGAQIIPGGTQGTSVMVRVRQTQVGNDIPEIFQMPLTVEFRAGDQVERRRFFNNQRDQSEVFVLPFAPEEMELDPDNAVLSVKPDTRVITDAPENAAPDGRGQLNITPNPVRPGELLHIEMQARPGAEVTLRLYDLLGVCRMKFDLGRMRGATDAFALRLPECAPGLYIVGVNIHNGAELRRAVVLSN